MKGFRPYVSIVFFLMVLLIPAFSTAEEKKVFTLNELLSMAIDVNPTSAVFKANLEASRGDAVSAGAYPNPEVEFEVGRGKSIETGESKGEYSLGIGQAIEWPSKRHFRKQAAKASVEATEKELDDFRLQLRSEVKTAFYRLLKDKKVLETAG
ncbi:MAG TPA: TolC family protein, partial [Syntrophales bacterium]|nr:TolC family protein [Syntrophales bacterium]